VKPKWTIVYNIVSPESNRWVGTGWEFFDKEEDATKCRERLTRLGNVVTKRPYYDSVDNPHMGAAHRATMDGTYQVGDKLVEAKKDDLLKL
jgi:hypothetical protein